MRREVGLVALGALFLAHCALRVDGLAAIVRVERRGALEVEAAGGEPVEVVRAELRIASIALVRCVGAAAAARGTSPASALEWLGPARAHAHGEPVAGPFVLDLRAASRELDAVPASPGAYCDVRLRVAPDAEGPTLTLDVRRADGGLAHLVVESEREVLLPIASEGASAGLRLDATHRTAPLALRVDLGAALARADLEGASDVAALAALGGLLAEARAIP